MIDQLLTAGGGDDTGIWSRAITFILFAAFSCQKIIKNQKI